MKKTNNKSSHFDNTKIISQGYVTIPDSIVDKWLPLLGVRGVAVYCLFCRLEIEGVVKGWSQHRLSKVLRIGKGSLQRIIAMLEECGFIKVVHPTNYEKSIHKTLRIMLLNPPTEISEKIIEKYAAPKGYKPLFT